MDKKNILKGRTSGWILKLDIYRIVKFLVKLDSKIFFLEVVKFDGGGSTSDILLYLLKIPIETGFVFRWVKFL